MAKTTINTETIKVGDKFHHVNFLHAITEYHYVAPYNFRGIHRKFFILMDLTTKKPKIVDEVELTRLLETGYNTYLEAMIGKGELNLAAYEAIKENVGDFLSCHEKVTDKDGNLLQDGDHILYNNESYVVDKIGGYLCIELRLMINNETKTKFLDHSMSKNIILIPRDAKR